VVVVVVLDIAVSPAGDKRKTYQRLETRMRLEPLSSSLWLWNRLLCRVERNFNKQSHMISDFELT
jgi:hypothetical protein